MQYRNWASRLEILHTEVSRVTLDLVTIQRFLQKNKKNGIKGHWYNQVGESETGQNVCFVKVSNYTHLSLRGQRIVVFELTNFNKHLQLQCLYKLI